MARSLALTGIETRFGRDEIIVSKTDLKGIITYANEVFVRLAEYPEQELVGAPHNLIRHPEMPRCVFKLLWDTIEAGNEIFAFVVNRARSGNHYWVLAHVTPTFDGAGRIVGYHSNRRCPGRQGVETMKGVYALLLAEEQRVGGNEGMRAAGELLGRVLAGRGQTYDEFVWSVINAEEK